MAWAAMIASKTTTVPPRLLLDLLGARCEDSRWNTLPGGRGQLRGAVAAAAAASFSPPGFSPGPRAKANSSSSWHRQW